jgi:hypothetical protein
VSTCSAQVGAISHWGALILQRARDQALAAAENSDACHAAIVLSATGVEAYVNELQYAANRTITQAQHPVVHSIATVLADLEEQRCQVEAKLAVCYTLLTRLAANRGAAPFQDLALLIALRNAVTHPRVLSGDSAEELAAHKLIRPLMQRKVIVAVDLTGHRTWDRVIFGKAASQVAPWAYNTAVAVVRWATDLITIPALQSHLAHWVKQCPPLSRGAPTERAQVNADHHGGATT